MTRASQIKSYIRSRFPRTLAAYQQVRHSFTAPSLETVFTEIYHNNIWNDPESISGRGSTLARTAVVRAALPSLLRDLDTRVLLDAACGDFNWMQHVRLDVIKYIGVDIVPELIADNLERYGSECRTFVQLDISRHRLPRADVILCRECMIHLSYASIKRMIANFRKSGAKYLICTTHTAVSENLDCPDGGWRSINLQIEPFNFPSPIQLIVEDPEMGKCLGVWRLADL